MAIWLCNNKGMYDRDVKDKELLGSNLFLLQRRISKSNDNTLKTSAVI